MVQKHHLDKPDLQYTVIRPSNGICLRLVMIMTFANVNYSGQWSILARRSASITEAM